MDELSIVTLAAAKKYTDEHGGGGGGTSNYNQLENKPQIGGVTLTGNKSASDLGLASATALANKVDKVDGKGLSTNDYTDTDKAIVDGVTAALGGKQDVLTAGRNINLSNDEVKAGVFVEAGVDIDIDEYSIQSGTETYTIAESGLYEIFYCLTLQSAVSLSLPESANVLIERDLSISNHPVKHIVVELEAGSTVTITQTPNQWRTVMSGILKLDAISVNNVVHADSIADSTVSYKLPNDDKYYLVIGTAVGNSVASNSTRDDTSGGNPTIVKTQSAEYAKFRSVIVKGSDSPNFSFYGYDGGVASIIAFEVSLEEGNWDYNLVTKDYMDAALAGKQDALTAGLYIEIDNNEISVKRDITQTAQQIEYNFTIPSDFTLRVKKYVNSDLVDTTDYTWASVVDPINLDSIMEVSKKAGNYWGVKNLIASTTQAADYSVDLYAMQQATNYTQNFVATIDADKKLIIQSELDAALADKVDKVAGKGLSKNDYTDADKAKVAASLNVFTGTQAEWAALSTAEKKTYQRADFTDDYDNTAIGDLTALHTSAKSSIVNAINEVADGKQNSTDNNLQTTSKTIVGGINEVKSGLTSLNFGKMIYDGTGVNINEIITPGWHYGSSTGAGLDTVDDYYMIVFHLGNYIKQFIIGKFGYGKKLYMRYSGDGGTSWSVSKIEFTDVT